MNLLRFFLSEAWEMQQRDRAAGFASLTALTAVLFLLAVVLLAGHNVRGAARSLEARKGVEVFLADGCSEERIEELAGIFAGFGEVSAVRFVSEDEALREVERDLGGIGVVKRPSQNQRPERIAFAMMRLLIHVAALFLICVLLVAPPTAKPSRMFC